MKNSNISFYLTLPEETESQKFVGVIVIQEWWGLDKHIKDLTIRFADLGYPTLAPDLFHNKTTKEPDEAQKLKMEMNHETALEEIGEAIDFLRVFCGRIVIAGFCMGGYLALKASEAFEVEGVLAFYPGGFDPKPEEIKKYNTPIKVFYGDKDGGYDAEKLKKIEEAFKKENKEFDLHVFKGAEHAYMNDNRPSFNKEASAESWKIISMFLHSI